MELIVFSNTIVSINSSREGFYCCVQCPMNYR